MRRTAPVVALALGLALAAAAAVAGVTIWGGRIQRSAESRLRGALAAMVESGGSLDVQLRAGPAWNLLRGRIESLQVHARRMRTGSLVADRLEVNGEGLQIDPAALARGGQLVVKAARSLVATAVYTEADVNAYLRTRYDVARLLSVQLLSEGPRLVLEVGAGEQAFTISVDGRLEVSGENAISLVLDRLAIQPGQAQALRFDLAGVDSPMQIEVGELPLSLHVERVEVAQGELHVFARYRGGE